MRMMRVRKWRLIVLSPVLIVLFVVWAVTSLIVGACVGIWKEMTD